MRVTPHAGAAFVCMLALMLGGAAACVDLDALRRPAGGGAVDGGGDAQDAGGVECGPFMRAAASSFSDDFHSGLLAPNWFSAQSCVTELPGEMRATPTPTGANTYCIVQPTASFHLTCDSVTVKVPQVTAQGQGPQTFIYVITTDNSHGLDLILEGGGFAYLIDKNQNIPLSDGGPYDPAGDLWWRLRESGGTLFFETSPDDQQWKVRAQNPDPFPLDDVTIAIGAGTYDPVPMPGEAHFHCYNVPSSSCMY
jgi:hypothetical protein